MKTPARSKGTVKAPKLRESPAEVIAPEPEETDKAKLIEMAIQKMEKKLASNEVKASIGDFIRLLQLQKEFYGDQPRQVTVTWIEPTEKDCVPEG